MILFEEKPPGYWNKTEPDLHPEQVKENEILKKRVLLTLQEMYIEKEISFKKYFKKSLSVMDSNAENSNFPDIYLKSFLATENFKFLE